MDFSQRRGNVRVGQRHPRHHQIEFLIRVGERLRSAADEANPVGYGAAEAEGFQVDIKPEGDAVRVCGDEGLAPRRIRHPAPGGTEALPAAECGTDGSGREQSSTPPGGSAHSQRLVIARRLVANGVVSVVPRVVA